MQPHPCRTEGCTRPAAHRRTFCHPCRQRIHRHGTPHITLRTDLDPDNVNAAVIRHAFPAGLTEAERRAVGKRLLQLGYSINHIAKLSGASTRTVARWKAALTT